MKRFSLLLLIVLLGTFFLEAAPVVSTNSGPNNWDVEARIRNGRTGWESCIWTSTPVVTMNPSGAPVWQWGENYDFEVTYEYTTGLITQKIDFNRNDSYSSDEISSYTMSDYAGKSFRFIKLGLWGNPNSNSTISSLEINGTNFSTYDANNDFATAVFEEENFMFGNITITGTFSFSANGNSDERPKISLYFGDTFNYTDFKVCLNSSTNEGLDGGSLKYHDNGWKNADAYKVSGKLGVWSIPRSVLVGNSATFEMTYNNGKRTISNVAFNNNFVEFQTRNVTAVLEKADGTDLSGGTAKFHQLGWQNWGAANTAKELLPGAYTFEMTYNNGKQTFSNFNVTTNDPIFTTRNVSPWLKNSENEVITEGGTVLFHQLGWQNWGAANTAKELLPGAYTFEMTYNNGKRTFSNFNVTENDPVFQTRSVTPWLKNSENEVITEGGTVLFHQLGWQSWGAANTAKELLPGAYTFEMTYNNGKRTFSNFNVTENDPVFQTRSVTPWLKNSLGTIINSGGSVLFHQLGWQNWGAANTSKELLPGAYTFEMTYNNGKRTFSNFNVTENDPIFNTVRVTPKLINSSGYNINSGANRGTIKFHQLGWQNWTGHNGTSNAFSYSELLPGAYTFEMTYNNGKQTYSNYNIIASCTEEGVTELNQSQDIYFRTVLVNSNATLFHQLGWASFDTKQVLPGRYTFKYADNTSKVMTFSAYEGLNNLYLDECTGIQSFSSADAQVVNQNLVTVKVENLAGNAEKNLNVSLLGYDKLDVYGMPREDDDDFLWEALTTGTTGTTGIFSYMVEEFTKVRAKVTFKNVTKNLDQSVISNRDFVFETNLAEMYVKQIDNYTPVQGIHVEYQGDNTLNESDNNVANYYSIANTDIAGYASEELLKKTYNFRFTDENGNRWTKSNKIWEGPLTVYTIPVTVNFNGTSNYVLKYKGNGKTWVELLNPDGSDIVYLLPGDYTFRLDYKGTYLQKTVKVREDKWKEGNDEWQNYVNESTTTYPSISFNSVSVSVSLENKGVNINNVFNSDNENTAIFEYYDKASRVWNSFDGDFSMDLLEKAQSFRFWVNNVRRDFELNLLNQTQTGNTSYLEFVYDENGNCTISIDVAEVNLHYTDIVEYKVGNNWYNYSKPMYLIPGNYDFRFAEGDPFNQEISGGAVANANISKTFNIGASDDNPFDYRVALVILENSQGKVIKDAEFKYRYSYETKESIEYTNRNGFSLYLIHKDDNPTAFAQTNVKYTVEYEGTTQEITRNISQSSVVKFRTVKAVPRLINHTGTSNLSATFKYRYSYEDKMPISSNGKELLPVNTKFTVEYNGTSIEKTVNLASGEFVENKYEPTLNNNIEDWDNVYNNNNKVVSAFVKFQTVRAYPSLKYAPENKNLSASYQYRYSYEDKTNLSRSGRELLPVNTKITVNYKGTSQERTFNLDDLKGEDRKVYCVFEAAKPEVKLISSTENPLTADKFEYRYSYEEKEIYKTNSPYFLPVNTKFTVTYGGTAMEKTFNLASQDAIFQTALWTIDLQNQNGESISGSGIYNPTFEYRYSYETKMAFTSGTELLPVNTKFTVIYGGTSLEKTQNYANGTNVLFTTNPVNVTINNNPLPDGAIIKFRYGYEEYTEFTSGTEFLPVNMKVHCTYNGTSQEKN